MFLQVLIAVALAATAPLQSSPQPADDFNRLTPDQLRAGIEQRHPVAYTSLRGSCSKPGRETRRPSGSTAGSFAIASTSPPIPSSRRRATRRCLRRCPACSASRSTSMPSATSLSSSRLSTRCSPGTNRPTMASRRRPPTPRHGRTCAAGCSRCGLRREQRRADPRAEKTERTRESQAVGLSGSAATTSSPDQE